MQAIGEDTIGPQACTYAEYRMAAALGELSARTPVHRARVILRHAKRRTDPSGVICYVSVDLQDAERMEFEALGEHAFAAVNRAVDRVRGLAAFTLHDTAARLPLEVV